MNYYKNYYNYINYIKQQILLGNRPKNKKEYQEDFKNIYFEFHHIIPKWKGGDESEENYIPLTYREHYLAHYLLWKFDKNSNNALAFKKMQYSNEKKCIITSRLYEIIKTKLHKDCKPALGWHPNEEQRKNMSIGKKKYFKNNPEKLQQYKENFKKAHLIACENKKKKYIDLKNNLPEILRIEDIQEVFDFIKKFNLTKGYTRKLNVNFICKKCKKLIQLKMKVFTEQNKKNLICRSCLNSDRMKTHNPNKDGIVNKTRKKFKFSEQHLKKLRNIKHTKESDKRRSNSLKGSLLWNNGIISIRSKVKPEGFVRGRLPDKKTS
jgi:hypothetical protein